MSWDFHVNAPESVHALMFLFGDCGTPTSLRNINGYNDHTYKFTKKDGSFHYVKIHIRADGGVKNLTNEEAIKLAGAINYIFEIAQAAFSPDIMVSGIEPSAEPTLQGRMFAYLGAAR
ncbi:uncharacterized protein Z518_03118 [Rhinocladiella mackenziei CBS 650.93]|uniref:Rhinocladiella mackenziei CBS 650.93 unplaced genomic scaffold supercont1.2, whole genome shotgun sequence n=1 Tax=Rhinocladiella mackenziei CBS 650.93 TaxID=1442369 RepID=A0A0D2G1U2_9EURO|nr:uncharacterized protein Z518_03118 [Rhinocladiella mackenziei CBS 650.93]KIX08462.1 hypothetical protein Z518_03118 [Rhinocladiella mackenziei CBS 650.93]